MERLHLQVTESSQAGEARRVASQLAHRLLFSEVDVGRVSIAVTEAATNLHKHARDGEIILCELGTPAMPAMGMLALDRGPGIADVGRAVRDGVSSIGTSGTGLGAIERQSDVFDLYSAPGLGTVLFAGFWPGNTRRTGDLLLGAVSMPHPGEEVNGDGWASVEEAERCVVLVADGLGHGAGAAEASSQARAWFLAHTREAPAEIVRGMHAALRPTRGAAVAVAAIDRGRERILFAGVGNIAGVVLNNGASRNMVSHHGTLGHDVRKIQEFEYPWQHGATVVLHSDGLLSQWSLARYPGLLAHHPMMVAALLYRDFRRARDDTTVIAIREATG